MGNLFNQLSAQGKNIVFMCVVFQKAYFTLETFS